MSCESIDKFITKLDIDDDVLCIKIEESIRVVEESIDRYGVNNLVLSFNGGKDASVIFNLVRYVLYKNSLKSLNSIKIANHILNILN